MLGEIIGAGGQLAGGILASKGGLSNGDIVNPVFDPNLNLAYQAAQMNALSGLGFGDVNTLPTPVQQLMGRIQGASIDEKTKRRALVALQGIQSGIGGGADFNTALAGTKNQGRLQQVMSRLGLTNEDVSRTFDSTAAFNQQIQKLRDAGLGGLNTDTILSRYRAANDAAQLIGSASQYGQTGQANGLVESLLNQDNRNLERFATRAGLQAQFGGASQAAAQKAISDAQLDQQLRVIQQALGLSSGIQAALNPATAAAGSASAGNANAAQIAAMQAQAANSLRNQVSQDRALSLGNAISGAAGSVGSGVSDSINVLGMILGSNFQGNAGLGSAGIGSVVNGFGAAGGSAAGAAGAGGYAAPTINAAASGTGAGWLGGLLAL